MRPVSLSAHIFRRGSRGTWLRGHGILDLPLWRRLLGRGLLRLLMLWLRLLLRTLVSTVPPLLSFLRPNDWWCGSDAYRGDRPGLDGGTGTRLRIHGRQKEAQEAASQGAKS